MDKTAIQTELGKTAMVTVTFTGQGGFAGAVTLTPSLATSLGAPIPNVTLMGPTSVAAVNGTPVTAQYMISVPPNATGSDILGAALNIAYSSTLGANTATATVGIAAVYTFTYAAGTGTASANHVTTGKTVTVKRGAKVHFLNSDTATHITHGDGAFPHEDVAGATSGDPNNTYEVLTIGIPPGSTGQLGCHSHGSGTYATVNVQ
jgi:hypothetical protein